jgi:hypothetical protein
VVRGYDELIGRYKRLFPIDAQVHRELEVVGAAGGAHLDKRDRSYIEMLLTAYNAIATRTVEELSVTWTPISSEAQPETESQLTIAPKLLKAIASQLAPCGRWRSIGRQPLRMSNHATVEVA